MLAPGVPALDELAGEWVAADELPHLPSLRNQWGQAHVNADLTSLSWLALPPFSGGYRTGVLRVDGRVRAADRFRWAPWGVARSSAADGIDIETETRLEYEGAQVLWRILVTNTTDVVRRVDIEQELLAPIAYSDVDWGWLYGTPWSAGHHHDFYATERVRADVLSDRPGQPHLVAEGARQIRLGRPRIPGIQRDEDEAPMLLDTALPAHITPDSPSRTRPPAARGTIQAVQVADEWTAGPWELRQQDDEVVLDAIVALEPSTSLSMRVVVDSLDDGVLLTHGNHPDSLQFGIEGRRFVCRIAGECIVADRSIELLSAYELDASFGEDDVVFRIDGIEVGRTAPWWRGQRWHADLQEATVVVTDASSTARSAVAFSAAPDDLRVEGQRGLASWRLDLAPGETAELGVVLAIGDDEDEARDRAAMTARSFDEHFAAVAGAWRTLWRHAFTPGNTTHSGHLPAFEATSPGLAKTYYLGALLMLYMRNTVVSPIGPVFLTGGPRLGATTTFYWDQSEWARAGAMLEPAGIRAWILAALAQPYDRSHSFDTRGLQPVGNHYAANDHALFTIVEHYVGITGDESVLFEEAAGRTVLDHLREMAARAVTGRATYGDRRLVDLGGDAWELLECVPNYRDVVVSFNAGYAGISRSIAALLRRLGLDSEAEAAELVADDLADAVIEQYLGNGRWSIEHPDGSDSIAHCLDTELVAAHLADRLTEDQRADLVAFVERELIDGDWMRALAPSDPVAAFSDRPDHGAAGAFAAWPGATSYALACLGQPDLAAEFLGRVHAARSGALWGQAVEARGGGAFWVAERGVSNRDSNAASAVTESVLAGLFGIRAGFAESGSGTSENEFGRLRNVRAVGFDLGSELLTPWR